MVHLPKFKPMLKIVTVTAVSTGANPPKVTKTNIVSIIIAFEFARYRRIY